MNKDKNHKVVTVFFNKIILIEKLSFTFVLLITNLSTVTQVLLRMGVT